MILFKKTRIFIFLVLLNCWCYAESNLPKLKMTDPILSNKEPTVKKEEALLLEESLKLFQSEKVNQAINLLKEKINQQSSSALDFALANFLFQTGKNDEAKTYYQKAIQKEPGFMRARANFARLYLELGDTQKSLKELQTVWISGSSSITVNTLLGYIYLINGDTLAAETAYRQAILLNPLDQNALLGLAKSLLNQEKHLEAKTLIKKLLEKNPQKKDWWALYANTCLALNDLDEAIVSLETAKTLNCISQDSLFLLADIYLHQNQIDSVIKIYNTILKTDSIKIPKLLQATQRLIQLNLYEEAKPLIERLMTHKKKLNLKENISFEFIQAKILEENKEFKKAVMTYQKVLEKEPNHQVTLLSIANLLRDQNKITQAIFYFQRAFKNKPNSSTLLNIAYCYTKEKKYQKAIKLLKTSKLSNDNQRVQNYLKQLYKAQESTTN